MREVCTENGMLRGTACGNPCYTAYKGIPYGTAPVGELRWCPPQPAVSWQGVRDATQFSCIAPQVRHPKGSRYQIEFFQNPEPMSEDCLYLNVWTPASDPAEKLPVLFWIHGGALAGGYSFEPEFDGEGYCRQGIILVTINYRVGALGFMAHPQLSAESGHGSGNYGHMDQIAALKWVKRNIAAFGGDPENITISGQSSGAISSQLLMTSPLSSDLMQKAILQSAGGVWPCMDGYSMPLQQAESIGASYMEKLGCTSIAQMRQLSWEDIISYQPSQPYDMRFSTCVDGYFLPDDPIQMVLRGEIADIPCILGNDSVEMPHHVCEDPELFAHQAQVQYGDKTEAYLALIPDNAARGRIGGMAHIMSVANRTFAELMETLGRKPAYLYYFTRDVPGHDHPGAFHSVELWYQFCTIDRCWRPMTGVDYDLSIAMSTYFGNFIKSANPNDQTLPTWTPYQEASPLSMELGETVGMIAIPEAPDQVFTRKFLLGKL